MNPEAFQSTGRTQLAPGIYRNAAGDMEYDVPALLRVSGVRDTRENCEAAGAALARVISFLFPQKGLEVRR